MSAITNDDIFVDENWFSLIALAGFIIATATISLLHIAVFNHPSVTYMWNIGCNALQYRQLYYISIRAHFLQSCKEQTIAWMIKCTVTVFTIDELENVEQTNVRSRSKIWHKTVKHVFMSMPAWARRHNWYCEWRWTRRKEKADSTCRQLRLFQKAKHAILFRKASSKLLCSMFKIVLVRLLTCFSTFSFAGRPLLH